MPTGGPKDTIPPALVKVIPENKSINFNKDEIILNFDEFIKTEDINSQLIITPRLEEENEYKVNKNILTIELNEELDSSTTYTFNFQNTVQDINESTPAEDLVIAFSTGTYIDSLSIQGTITELLTNKPVEEVVVALYEANDTLDIFNSKPQYFTRTREDGTYKIENLKADTFKIYAFSDENSNLTAQSDKEPYGFMANEILLDSLITTINIPIVRRNVKEFMVQSARPNGKYFEIKFNKYVDDYTIKSLSAGVDSIISNPIADHSTMRIYNTITTDSVEAEITAIDTIGHALIDTVYIKFPPTQRVSDPISHTIEPASNQLIEENYEGKIRFNKPTYIVSLDSAFVYYDSLFVDSTKRSEITWNKYHNILTINKKLDKSILTAVKNRNDSLKISNAEIADSLNVEPGENQNEELVSNQPIEKESKAKNNKDGEPKEIKNKFEKPDSKLILFFSKNTFRSIENDTIPEILALYSFKEHKDMGLIKGTVKTDKGSYTIQLLDKSFEPIKEISNVKSFTFDLVPPGEYQLRILIDNDLDGVWEPGNILKNEPPEDIFFVPEPIIIRANWERILEEIEF